MWTEYTAEWLPECCKIERDEVWERIDQASFKCSIATLKGVIEDLEELLNT